MKIMGVLLAAGLSTRFGSADKLKTPLHGFPLGLHAAQSLRSLPLAHRFVVARSTGLDWPGFSVIENDRPEEGISRSIALGVAAARLAGADAVLIALADMPFVPSDHFRRLLACYHGPTTLAASSGGCRRSPPALFGADWLPTLEQLSGDEGARALLASAEIVITEPSNLRDIDRPEDLSAIRTPKPR